MNTHHDRLPMLDGIRAISIVAVLITHLFPVRLWSLHLNESLGLFGMALFFILSGFLITGQLLHRPPVSAFVVRRLARIAPTAWLCLMIIFGWQSVDTETALSHFFFYANIPPQHLIQQYTAHFWSLCLEVQFYALAALVLWLRISASWWLFPLLLLAATILRINTGTMATSITWFRADDLLAGTCLALLVQSKHWPAVRETLSARSITPMLLLIILCFCCYLPKVGSNPLGYLRPYIAGLWVASLLANPQHRWSIALSGRTLAYIATISYALYLWHTPLAATWLGSGDVHEKYLKRPLLLVILFCIAHISTFYVERPFIKIAKHFETWRANRLKEA